MAVSTTGLTLQRVPFSETSQVATFLTRDMGRIVSMVKGAFRVKNNFQGNMDLLELSRLTFSRPKGGSMLLLRRRVLIRRFPVMRGNIRAFACASLINELLRLGIQEGQRTPGLFSFTLRVLEAIESESISAQNAALLFQGAFLKFLGFAPALDACVDCHARPSPGSLLVVFPKQGGILCKNCRSSERDGLRISWETSRLLLQAVARDLPGFSTIEPEPETTRQLWSFFELFLQYYLELRINSFAFIKQLDF